MRSCGVAPALVTGLTAAILVLAAAPEAGAAEGAASHYLPGAGGDILLAQPPEPGLLVANSLYFQSGDIGAAVLQGRVRLGLDLDLFLDLASATYTFEQSVLGGTYTVGAMVPFGRAKLDATLTGPLGGQIRGDESSFNLSDIAFIPLQLNWSYGNFSFKLSEAVIAPTGAYSTDNFVNLGRNYWSFDTVGAMTWFNPDTGTEASIAPGIMVNTKNDETNYKTGTEFHVDFTANQFLSESFAIGLRGYYYKQLTGDSGSGALLGDFKSESFGFGPGFIWTPKQTAGRLTVFGKWMHDFQADNRFESDYGLLGVAWKF